MANDESHLHRGEGRNRFLRWPYIAVLMIVIPISGVLIFGGVAISEPVITFVPEQSVFQPINATRNDHTTQTILMHAKSGAYFFNVDGTLYLEVQRTQNTLLGKSVKHMHWTNEELEKVKARVSAAEATQRLDRSNPNIRR